LILTVSDIDTARADLVNRGVEVSEVFHLAGGRVPGPDPERRSYETYVAFSDPDGNGWVLQEKRRDSRDGSGRTEAIRLGAPRGSPRRRGHGVVGLRAMPEVPAITTTR
jgi:hypothetical protein